MADCRHHIDHQTNDKARVAAAAEPKTRISNNLVVIAPDVVWAAAVVDKGVPELPVPPMPAVPVMTAGVAVPVALPTVLLLLLLDTTVDVLVFNPIVADIEIFAAKDG